MFKSFQWCVPLFFSENEVISKYGHDHHHGRQKLSNQIFKWSIKNHEIKKIIMLEQQIFEKCCFDEKINAPNFKVDYEMQSFDFLFYAFFCAAVVEEGGSHAPNLASSHLPKYLQCHQYIWQRPPSLSFQICRYNLWVLFIYIWWVGISVMLLKLGLYPP